MTQISILKTSTLVREGAKFTGTGTGQSEGGGLVGQGLFQKKLTGLGSFQKKKTFFHIENQESRLFQKMKGGGKTFFLIKIG